MGGFTVRKQHVSKFFVLSLLGVILIVGSIQVEASSDLSLTIGHGERDTEVFEFKVIQTSSKLVQGYFFASGLFGTIEGPIDCFSLNGNTAVFGGSNFTVMAKDDPFGTDGIIIGGAANCDTTGFGVPISITKGNIVVTNPDFFSGQ
jgi:hypothetical protein